MLANGAGTEPDPCIRWENDRLWQRKRRQDDYLPHLRALAVFSSNGMTQDCPACIGVSGMTVVHRAANASLRNGAVSICRTMGIVS
jgi:hypothetical protein